MSGALSPVISVPVAAILAILFRCVRVPELYRAVDCQTVAFQVSVEAGVDAKPFLVGLAIRVSAGFCAAVAHESTVLVMAPRRYRFKALPSNWRSDGVVKLAPCNTDHAADLAV
jgi:hypothetical protein